jgi:hypothetical protein
LATTRSLLTSIHHTSNQHKNHNNMKFPEQYRITTAQSSGFGTEKGDPFGMFFVPRTLFQKTKMCRSMKVMVSDGNDPLGVDSVDWEHVSVSLVSNPKACPSWDEMCFIKSLFWDDEACVVQFHPAKSNYKDLHPGCLHLWRYRVAEFPTPPLSLV